MIAFCLTFPIFTQLKKYAAGDIVASLTRLKKDGFELKFFVLTLTWRKEATFKNCDNFSDL